MRNTIVKGIAVATALSIGALTFASPAEAGRRWHRHHHGHNGGTAAAILFGLGAAAIIANASRPRYYDYGYAPTYYAPRYAPQSYAYAPTYGSAPPVWSPAWYQYCSQKWLSFDPRDGTFQPNYGPRRLCY